MTGDEAEAMRALVDAGFTPADAGLAIVRIRNDNADQLTDRAHRVLDGPLVRRLQGYPSPEAR